MLAKRTLKILLAISRRDRALAEQRAADASKNISTLDANEVALNRYVAELADGRLSEIRTGYDLLSHGNFIQAGIKAIEANRQAQMRGVQQKDAATQQIVREKDRHKAIKGSLDERQRGQKKPE